MRLIKTLLPFVLVTILLSGVADAKPRGRFQFLRSLVVPPAAVAPAEASNPHERYEPNNPSAYWSMEPELYPQWYGGFSGRMLQNLGYPSGELGLRRQAW